MLRGLQGTSYGRNSIGGAIDLIAKAPGTEAGGRVSVEAGSRGRLNGHFYSDTSLGEEWAIAVTGGFKKHDGVGNFPTLPNVGVGVGELQEVFGRVAQRRQGDGAAMTLAADMNDGKGALRPYTTFFWDLPSSALVDAGFTEGDLAAAPYDNNTGQAAQTRITNQAYGISLTAHRDITSNLASRVIASSRESEYKAGLDDDSLFEDFLSFPEVGEARQISLEIEINGDHGNMNFVSGFYFFEEDGDIVNVDISCTSPDGSWTTGLYGRNVSDERYDNARLNTGDDVLRILSNDPSEFGIRIIRRF